MLRRRRVFSDGPLIRSYGNWVITTNVKDKNGETIESIPASGGQYTVSVSASREVHWSYGPPTKETVIPEIKSVTIGSLDGLNLTINSNTDANNGRTVSISIEIKKEGEDDFTSSIVLITQDKNEETDIEYGTPEINEFSYSDADASGNNISPVIKYKQTRTQHWTAGNTTSLTDIVVNGDDGTISYKLLSGEDYASINEDTGVITWEPNENVDRTITIEATVVSHEKTVSKTTEAKQVSDTVVSTTYSDISSTAFTYVKTDAKGGTVSPNLGLSQTKTITYASGKVVTETLDETDMVEKFSVSNYIRCELENHDKTTEWEGDVNLLTGSSHSNHPSINEDTGVITWLINEEYDVVYLLDVTVDVSANGKTASYTTTKVLQTNNYVTKTTVISDDIKVYDYDIKNAAAGAINPSSNNSATLTYERTELTGTKTETVSASTVSTSDGVLKVSYELVEGTGASINENTGAITWLANEGDARTVSVKICYELQSHVGEEVVPSEYSKTVSATQSADNISNIIYNDINITKAEYPTVSAAGGAVNPIVTYTQTGTEIWTSGKQVPINISFNGADDEYTAWDVTTFAVDDRDDITLDNNTGKLTWDPWPYNENNGKDTRTGTITCTISRNEKTSSKQITVTQTCDEVVSTEYGAPVITVFSYDVKDANEGTSTPTISYSQSVTRHWLSGADESLDPITYTGPDDNNTSYRLKANVNGVSLDTNTGVLTWEDNTSLSEERKVTVIAAVNSNDLTGEKETIAVQAKDSLQGTTVTYDKPVITRVIKELAPAEGCVYDGSYLIIDYTQEKTTVNHYISGDVTTKETLTGTLTRDVEHIHTDNPVIPAGTKVCPETQVASMTLWITVNGIDSDKLNNEPVNQEEIFVEDTEYEYGEYVGTLAMNDSSMLPAGYTVRTISEFGAVHRSKTTYETLNSGIALPPVTTTEYFNGDIAINVVRTDDPTGTNFCRLMRSSTEPTNLDVSDSEHVVIFTNINGPHVNQVYLYKDSYYMNELYDVTYDVRLLMSDPSNSSQWLIVEKLELTSEDNTSDIEYLAPTLKIYTTVGNNITAKAVNEQFALTTFEATQNAQEVWTSGSTSPLNSVNAIYGDSVITKTTFSSDVDWITVDYPNINISANTSSVDRTGNIVVDIVMNGVAGRGTKTITQAADALLTSNTSWDVDMVFEDMPSGNRIPAQGGSYILDKDKTVIVRTIEKIWESEKPDTTVSNMAWDDVIGTALNIGSVTTSSQGQTVSGLVSFTDDTLTFNSNTESYEMGLDVSFPFTITRAPYNVVHTEVMHFTLESNVLISNSYSVVPHDVLIKNNTTGEYLTIDSSQKNVGNEGGFSDYSEADLGTLVVPAKGDSYSITQVFKVTVTREYSSGMGYMEYFYVDQDDSFVSHLDYDNSGYNDDVDDVNSEEWLPSSMFNSTLSASGSSLITVGTTDFTFTTQNNKSLDRANGVISILLDGIPPSNSNGGLGIAISFANRFSLVLEADTLRESYGKPDSTYFSYNSTQPSDSGWIGTLFAAPDTYEPSLQYIQTVMRYWNCDNSFYDAYNITTGADIVYSLRSNGDGLDFVTINSSTGAITLENNESDETRTFAVVAVITMNGRTSDDEICLCTQEAGVKIYSKWSGGDITLGKSILSAGSDSTTVTIAPWTRTWTWNGNGEDHLEYYTGNVTITENGGYTSLSETSYTASSSAKTITLMKDTCGVNVTEETAITITVTGATIVGSGLMQEANESHAYYDILGTPNLTYPTVGPGMTSTPTSDIKLSTYFTSGALDADIITDLTLGDDFLLYSPQATGETEYMSFGPDGSVIWDNDASGMEVKVTAELVTESHYFDANGNQLRYLFSDVSAFCKTIEPEDNLELPLHIISYGADLTITCDPGMDGMGSIYMSKNGTSWRRINFAEEDLVIPADTVIYLGSFTKGEYDDDSITLEDASKLVISSASSEDYTVELYGNIMSLVDKDNFSDLTECTETYQFAYLFKDWEKLTKAPMLPADVLSPYCYRSMFHGCTSLWDVQDLNATELNECCYAYMFYGCTSLETSPYIAASEMSRYSCQQMFCNCTSLTDIQEICATTLSDGCYNSMFQGCTLLTTAPELPATILASSCYNRMFQGCTSLVNAPELPAMTMVTMCYEGMFHTCTALTTAPELPAETLAQRCYYQMFVKCSALTDAPELPATTLANQCYSYMFQNCTSLTSAPALLAPVLANQCYAYMFQGCRNLAYIQMMATDINFTRPFNSWVANVAKSGEFVKMMDTELPIGNDGIPEGWVVTEESGPLTFKALVDNSSVSMTTGTSYKPSLEYSLNGGEWTAWDYGAISLSANDKVEFRGDNTYINTSSATSKFACTGQIELSGSLMSLLSKENFDDATISSNYCFQSLFNGNTGIIYSHKLVMPNHTKDYCYSQMFYGCSALKTTPELPATTLTTGCYYYMFNQCTSLIKAPSILPATTVPGYGYHSMFYNCKELRTAPKVCALTLSSNACTYMFRYCSNLNFINAMFTTTPSASVSGSWTGNVSATGTFIKNPEASWNVTSAHGIPSGWTNYQGYSHVDAEHPIRMWIDDFIDEDMTMDDRAADYGYSSVDDYVEGIIAANDKLLGNAYDYTGETMEWNGKTYYVWNYIDLDGGENTGMFKILTDTIDFNKLFMNSMEYNCRNEHCPIVAWLFNDDELYMDSTDAANHWLIQVQYV